MNVTRIPIISCAREDSPLPWYELDTDAIGKIAIGVANHSGKASPLAKSQHDIAVPVDAARAALAARVEGAPPERLAVAVTLDDVIEIVPMSQQRFEYQAHLGFYDPATDTLELLQFVEQHTEREHWSLDHPDEVHPDDVRPV